MKVSPRSAPELEALAQLYYPSVEALADFEELHDSDLPEVYRMLLAHDQHMTVTLESHHGSPVEVEVLDSIVTETHYQRKVLLRRTSDHRVVLFGIVRITRSLLAPDVRELIEGEVVPLGRILIARNVLRNVRLLSLWKIEPGEDLCDIFGFPEPKTCYGRTALIYCDRVPVIELLEVVTTY